MNKTTMVVVSGKVERDHEPYSYNHGLCIDDNKIESLFKEVEITIKVMEVTP